MSTCASSWVLSIHSRCHTIRCQVLRFAICWELHSQENWFEMVILYWKLPCFTSSSTLLSLFRKVSIEILDFGSFAFLKIARKSCESTNLNLLLAFAGCEKWFNGSVEVGSSSAGAKTFSYSSIKQCAGPICLRDDLSDNSRGKGSPPVHLSIYSVLPFCLKMRWIYNVIVNSINQWDVDPHHRCLCCISQARSSGVIQIEFKCRSPSILYLFTNVQSISNRFWHSCIFIAWLIPLINAWN